MPHNVLTFHPLIKKNLITVATPVNLIIKVIHFLKKLLIVHYLNHFAKTNKLKEVNLF